MLYIVIYRDPHSGWDSVRAIAANPDDAFRRMIEACIVRSLNDPHCHRMDWSIWEFDILTGIGTPFYIYSGCTHYSHLDPFQF